MKALAGTCLVLLLIVSCSRNSPEEKLVRSVDPAASWIPALQMTAEKWVGNSVPAAFAQSAAHAAQKEFKKAQKEVARSKATRGLRDRFASDFEKANAFAEELEDAVGHDDPRRIAPRINTLPLIKSDLDAIRKQYGGGS